MPQSPIGNCADKYLFLRFQLLCCARLDDCNWKIVLVSDSLKKIEQFTKVTQ